MLDRLQPRPGARRLPKRVGRGPGSRGSKTAGRGEKGQGKRSPGREVPFHFEGGQMSLVRRLPKRGFHQLRRKVFQIVNLGSLVSFGEGATVDVEALTARGMVARRGGPVKLLAQGDAPRGLTVRVHAASAAARKQVDQAGGRVETIR